jgi:hypothetical protein
VNNSETRGDAFQYYKTLGPSKEDEAAKAIEELVSDLGTKAVVSGVSASSISHLVGQTSASQNAQAISVMILARIIDSADPRKEADIMALACGLLLREGGTITSVAEKYGVTKQDISKSAVEFCERMGLPPSHAMLPEASREKYKLTNRRNHKK